MPPPPLRSNLERTFKLVWSEGCGALVLPRGTVRIICSIEERWFTKITLYVIFVDHRPIKVEWSLIGSDTNWRTENGNQRGAQISFEIFGHCSKITSNHKQKVESKILKPTGVESTQIDYSQRYKINATDETWFKVQTIKLRTKQ
jgi:hypothetical protein